MRLPSRRLIGCAWVILVALALPLVAEALPACGDEMAAGGCEDGLIRCAGLWGAACCDFAAPRTRLQDTIEAPMPTPGLEALPASLYAGIAAPTPELPDPEDVPAHLTTGSGAGPILSSTVLRL